MINRSMRYWDGGIDLRSTCNYADLNLQQSCKNKSVIERVVKHQTGRIK